MHPFCFGLSISWHFKTGSTAIWKREYKETEGDSIFLEIL